MANIIKLRGDAPPAAPSPAPFKPINAFGVRGRALLAWLVRLVWVVTVLVWPVLKWIVSIEVFFQFVLMVYRWDAPGVYAGWTFLVHFSVLTALTYFVSFYKPKGI